MHDMEKAIAIARVHMERVHAPHPGKGRRPRLDWVAVVEKWGELHNAHTLAVHFGAVQTAISRILCKCGIHAGRGSRVPLIALPLEEISRRYLAGESTVALGVAFGVDSEVIRKRLIKHDIPIRGMMESRARGEKNGSWNGGEGKYNPMHYFRRQSYEVAAICTGQPLPQGTVIHHLDENPKNNAPENLVLFPSLSDHTRFHMLLLKLQREGSEVEPIHLALRSGGRALPQPPAPLRFVPCTIPHDRVTWQRKPSSPRKAS